MAILKDKFMNKKHLIAGLIITVLSLYYAFRDVKIDELGMAFASIKYIYLLPALLMVILSYLFRALRWRYLISAIKDVKTADIFSPLVIGFMGNMLPARAGEFIRAYLLSKQENISFSSSFATIFIERLFDMAMVLLLLFWVFYFKLDVFASGDQGENHKLLSYMMKFGWISLMGCLFIFFFSALLQYRNDLAMKMVGFFAGLLPEKWREKIFSLVRSFTEGLKIMKDKSGFINVILLSVVIWFIFIATHYPLYLAFGIEDKLPVVSSLVILCLTISIFIALFPTPGFLGAFQAACVVALHEIFKIPKAVALSYGIIAWLVSMGFT
ncbi:MAG: flippase-like domain-containing protein [Nitrospirae bacterium]|nr:flippase-like domain-containing protein [Nitrospirota bacterium]